MAQNQAVQTALLAAGGIGFLHLDADGNLKVTLGSESGGAPVTVADGADVALGAKADAADSTAATGSLIALIKGLQRPLNQTYETVAASQTDQVMGGAGAIGDTLAGILIVPATLAAGNVSIKDGSGSAISVFATGTLADLTPIWLPLNIRSAAGAWKVTTGANVSVIGIGNFT